MGENRRPEDTPEWEQSKENVLPLRGGRKLSELSAALSGSSESKLKEQQDAFELELRMYVGDDPLTLWYRYVSWIEQNYPRGGREANLKSLLEKCVGTFVGNPHYMNDGRYLDLCIKLANMYPEPTEVFSYLHSHSIGSQLALFYIAWSWALENSGNTKMADAVLQQGLSRGAQPIEKLQKCNREFQARVIRSIGMAMDDPTTGSVALDSEHTSSGFLYSSVGHEQPRSTLAELRMNHRGRVGNDRASAALSVGSVTLGGTGGSSGAVQQTSNGSWKIYSDYGGINGSAGGSNGPALPPQNKEWARIPESAPKENSIKPSVWAKAKVAQKPQPSASAVGTSGSHRIGGTHDGASAENSSSRFTVHCDSDEPTSDVSQPRCGMSKTSACPSAEGVVVIGYRSVLSSHRAEAPSDTIERLNSLRPEVSEGGTGSETTEVSMYDKHKLYMGVNEVCFEELRAGKWLKRHRQKLERQRELEEHNRVLEARLRAAHEAEREQLRIIRDELEAKQRVLHEREHELERRQHDLAMGQQHDAEAQQAKRLRLQNPVQPEQVTLPPEEPAVHLRQQLGQQCSTGAVNSSGPSASVGISSASATAAAAVLPPGSNGQAKAFLGEVLLTQGAPSADVGESLTVSVSQLNLGAHAATATKPLGFLPLTPVNPPSVDAVAAAAPSPAGVETRHVLGWYCGSFDTSARPAAAAADQSSDTFAPSAVGAATSEWSPSFQEPAGRSFCAPQKFFVHEDAPAERCPAPRLQIYQDDVDPAPPGRLGTFQEPTRESLDAPPKFFVHEDVLAERGPALRLQIYQDEVDPTPHGRPDRPAPRTLAFGGRQQVGPAFQNPEAVGRPQVWTEDERDGFGNASGRPLLGGGGAEFGSNQKSHAFWGTAKEAQEQQPVSGRQTREPDRGERNTGQLPLQQRMLTVGQPKREALLAASAEAPSALLTSEQTQQRLQSAFQPVRGSLPGQGSAPPTRGAAAAMVAAAYCGRPARAEQVVFTTDKENCLNDAGRMAAGARQPLEATARDVPLSSDPSIARAAQAPRPMTKEEKEEPMDGVETIHRNLTEQLLGVSATPFARQASTPCSYRSSAAYGLLAACPDDLTTIHPVLLLGSGACSTDDDRSGAVEASLDAAAAAQKSSLRLTGAPWRPLLDQPSTSWAPAAAAGASKLRAAPGDGGVLPLPPRAGGLVGAAPASRQPIAGPSVANDTAPLGFGRPATSRLSPIVERNDSSKGSSSSSSGHVTTGSMSSQMLSRAASLMSSSTTPHQASRDNIAQTSSLLSQQRLQQQYLPQPTLQLRMQPEVSSESGPSPSNSAFVGADKPAVAESESASSGSRPAPLDGVQFNRAKKVVGFSTKLEGSDCPTSQPEEVEKRRRSPTRLSSAASPPSAWSLAMPKDWDASTSDCDVPPLEQLAGGDVTTHEIDTTHYCPAAFHDATQTELLINMSITLANNPFDKKVLTKLLGRLRPPLATYKGYCKVPAELPAAFKANQRLDLGGGSCCTIVEKIGEGGFASTYVASWTAAEAHQHSLDVSAWEENHDEYGDKAASDMCIKVQRPAGGGEWEFYICSQVHRRLGEELRLERFTTDVRASIMNVSKAYFFANGSVLVNEYLPKGTLLNLVNQQLAVKCRVPEAVVMYLTVELLSIVEQLHACRVIHGDIKPDNLLLRGLFPLAPTDEQLCTSTRSLLLIDFGRSIDMTKFPDGTTFTASNDTSGFQCIEMKTERPWTYQTDMFGLVGTVHVLLFGEYMKVYCTDKQWKINSKFQRFWQVDLWKDLFDTLLNIPDCNNLPALTPIRRQMEERLRGSKLSKEYADFVKRYNAGVPK